MISEVCAANGSSTAVAQSGTSIMSDSLIAFQPAIDEPSNITPSFRKSSLIVRDVMGQMLPLAARIGEAEVDVFDVVLLDHIENFLRIGHRCFLGYVQG